MPRIVERVARAVGRGVRVEILPYENSRMPTRLHLSAGRAPRAGSGEARGYPCPLNVFLTWDDEEIERLLDAGGEARFLRYLEAIGAKLDAWQGAREVDFATCSQAEPSVLFGGLDFEA
ncbi:hypothetical protein AWB83_01732 [Caballeronia ptereochthonis]|uniref:DUF5594 domain-containing protein n=2 Tax=Caballeronia ptereochthonis TaxID=1777144 RepID=A0A158AE00_9BURK|nr:hypothetical protein AWB83_01732 [Caballeronia ptereochthonis]